jgi:hypothetical protein
MENIVKSVASLIEEYTNLFNEVFPYIHFMHLNDEDIKKIIKKSIENNKPVKVTFSKNDII